MIARSRILLKDDGVRYPDAELWLWLVDAINLIGDQFPVELAGYDVLVLESGSDLQKIPDGWRALLDVECNIEPSGTLGSKINRVDAYTLRAVSSGVPAREIDEYYSDDNSGRWFHVSPPPRGALKVRALGSLYQKSIENDDDELVLSESFRSALVDYVCGMALLKDAEYADNFALSAQYIQGFSVKSGVKVQGRARIQRQKEVVNED